jgi:L-ascorbate metabolism protein UlaG (beta-lactamase superfamily)
MTGNPFIFGTEEAVMATMRLLEPWFQAACCAAAVALLAVAAVAHAGEPLEKDLLKGPGGELEITFVGHASLVFSAGGVVVHVDPWGRLADYAALPKADLVLVTHEHQDHLDPAAIAAVCKGSTHVIAAAAAAAGIPGAAAMGNGDRAVAAGVQIEAVPAYNLRHEREPGVPYHPKGRGNGYVLTLAGLRVCVAGDTENIPEMKTLAGVDVAFLPMNLPYTMTPEMAADAALMIRPKILYPYHFGETDASRLVALLRDHPAIEVRIRRMP